MYAHDQNDITCRRTLFAGWQVYVSGSFIDSISLGGFLTLLWDLGMSMSRN
ncbi:MAG: hypothetical protein IPJ66_14975 [Bacteroidetes bacterium]|nr:hypothetical protein [Bacteroidota bacterium]